MIKIQHKRGTKARLPSLSVAEIGFTTDTNEVFIGGNNGNVQLDTLDENGNVEQLPELDFYSKEETLANDTKTLFGLDASAVPDAVFNKIKTLIDSANSNADNKAKIQIGSYIGTGTSGSNNKNSISLNFQPKIVFVGRQDYGLRGGQGELDWNLSFVYFYGQKSALVSRPNVVSGETILFLYNVNKLEWYYDYSGSGMSDIQLNESGVTYTFIAIG